MTYEISEPHEPKVPLARNTYRTGLMGTLRALPVGKAVTVTDEARTARALQAVASATCCALKQREGREYRTNKVGDHSIQITRIA